MSPGSFGDFITLGPGKSIDLEICFSPKSRIQEFKCEIMVDCLGVSQNLLTVSGGCLAVLVDIDVDSLPFGPCIRNSISEKRIVISNKGDIGAGFKWDDISQLFTISPNSGYLTPGTEQPLIVSFQSGV